MQLSVTRTGLLNANQLQAWTVSRQQQNRKNVAEGLRAAAPKLTALVREAAARGLRLRTKKLLKAFKTKIWDRDATRLPQLQLYGSKRVPWLDIQETGGSISGRMVIPLLPEGVRIGRKAFSQLLDLLTRRGFIFYRKEGNTTLIFAENPAGKDRIALLNKFKAGERERRGTKRLKSGTDILIGVIVTRVHLRARLGFQAAARRGAPIVAAAIQAAIDKNG